MEDQHNSSVLPPSGRIIDHLSKVTFQSTNFEEVPDFFQSVEIESYRGTCVTCVICVPTFINVGQSA